MTNSVDLAQWFAWYAQQHCDRCHAVGVRFYRHYGNHYGNTSIPSIRCVCCRGDEICSFALPNSARNSPEVEYDAISYVMQFPNSISIRSMFFA